MASDLEVVVTKGTTGGTEVEDNAGNDDEEKERVRVTTMMIA